MRGGQSIVHRVRKASEKVQRVYSGLSAIQTSSPDRSWDTILSECCSPGSLFVRRAEAGDHPILSSLVKRQMFALRLARRSIPPPRGTSSPPASIFVKPGRCRRVAKRRWVPDLRLGRENGREVWFILVRFHVSSTDNTPKFRGL